MEERTFQINGTTVNVSFVGEGRKLLALHGWGKSVDHSAFDELASALKGSPVQIIAPDLPGFGQSSEPDRPWSVDDYADCIEALVAELDLRDVILLGHSHGGRISLKLAARNPKWLTQLYLCAAAGVSRELLFKRRLGLFLAKVGHVFFCIPGVSYFRSFARRVLYKFLRVYDYEQASESMRKTMSLVIAEDLTPCLEKITVPTELFWGEDDTLTPLADGKFMKEKIQKATLHTFPGVRHRVHRDKAREIAESIRTVL